MLKKVKTSVLFFPSAGSSPSTYFNMIKKAPKHVSISVVNYPGREKFKSKPFSKSCLDLVNFIGLENIEHFLHENKNNKTIFMGHSLGTWVMFELINQLTLYPDKVIISTFPSPCISENKRPWQKNKHLDDKAFQDELSGWEIDSRVFKPFIWEKYKDLLRNDCTLFDEYVFNVNTKYLDIETTLIYACDDIKIKKEMMLGWKSFFKCTNFKILNGNHRFLENIDNFEFIY